MNGITMIIGYQHFYPVINTFTILYYKIILFLFEIAKAFQARRAFAIVARYSPSTKSRFCDLRVRTGVPSIFTILGIKRPTMSTSDFCPFITSSIFL